MFFAILFLKKSLKETACRIACVAGVWKGRERGFWARGKREGRASRVSLAPKTPFPFPFKPLPRRLWRCRMNQGPVWNTYKLHLRFSWKEHQRRLQVKTPRSEDVVLFPKWSHTMQPETSDRKFWSPFIPGERSTAKDTLHWFVWIVCSVGRFLACENIRFSSPFTAGEVSREKSPAAKSEMEKRMFSQDPFLLAPRKGRIGEATMTGVSPTRH